MKVTGYVEYHVEKMGRHSTGYSYFDYLEFSEIGDAVKHMNRVAERDPHAKYRVIKTENNEYEVASMDRTCEHAGANGA